MISNINKETSDTSSALCGRLWIPRLVSTIIINHVIHPHPFVQPHLIRAQVVVTQPFQPIVGIRCATCVAGELVGINLEISVRGHEWGFSLVDLLKPSLRHPVIYFPKSREYPHHLIPQEWNASGFD